MRCGFVTIGLVVLLAAALTQLATGQSANAKRITSALLSNLTSSQMSSYFLHVASWDDSLANAIYYLTKLSITSSLCLVGEMSDAITYVSDHLDDPLSVVYMLLEACNNNQTTGDMGNMLMPFTKMETVEALLPVAARLFKKFPLQFRAALTYLMDVASKVSTDGYVVSQGDIGALKQIIDKLNANPKQYTQVVALLPSTIELFEGDYNAPYLTIVDNLGAFYETVPVDQATADEINAAIVSLYDYAYTNFLDFLGFGFNFILQKEISTKVNGNSTFKSSVTSFISTISFMLAFASTTIQESLDGVFADPMSINATV